MSNEAILDESQLKVLRSLNEGKENDLVDDLIEMFEEFVPSNIEKLKAAIEGESVEEIEHFAHKLKGSCANIGAVALRFTAQELEHAAKKNEVKDGPGAMKKIEELYTSTIQELKNNWYKKKKSA